MITDAISNKRVAVFTIAIVIFAYSLFFLDSADQSASARLTLNERKLNVLENGMNKNGSNKNLKDEQRERREHSRRLSERERKKLQELVDFELPKRSSSTRNGVDDDEEEEDLDDDDEVGDAIASTTTTTQHFLDGVALKRKRYKKKRTREQKMKQSERDLKQMAISKNPDDVVHGWIRAMFNQMDVDRDGKISMNELKEYAERMNLDKGYVKDFSEFVHIKAGEPKSHDHPAVDFDHFLAALQQRDATVMRACAMGGYGGRTIFDEVFERSVWLLGLLVMQSLSGVVLQRYEQLLARHVVIAVFLTMLVGAGGNAGNQSAIKIIEKIVLGEITVTFGSFFSEMHRECIVGVFLCVFVSIGGFIRAFVTHGRARNGFLNVLALTCCLAVIVFSSTIIGVTLPFVLSSIGADPSHAGTVVQVVMDVTGVVVTVTICSIMLGDEKGITPAWAKELEHTFLSAFPAAAQKTNSSDNISLDQELVIEDINSRSV
jgi:cation transporter-like permease